MEAAWLSETDLCVLWMNRGQDIAYYTLCKHPDFICKQVSFNHFLQNVFSPYLTTDLNIYWRFLLIELTK